MFRAALLKLTGLYLLLLMAVSVFFSLNLYRISTTEINNRLNRQLAFINNVQPNTAGLPLGPGRSQFEAQRIVELQASEKTIMAQLLYANVVILIAGGLGSYMLARRTLKPIEQAHAAQSRFAADASHELRTPLAAMRIETEVTLRNPKLLIGEAKQQLASNLEELERLTELSDGLLQLARGNTDVTKTDVIYMRAVLNEAVKQRSKQAASKKIAITVHKTPKIPLGANQTQLIQAVVILLDNAIKYSPSGATIVLRSEVHHHRFLLHITDTGMGMNASEISQIFDRFYRADSARSSTTTPGYGLGLSLAQQLIEASGGTLSAVSTPGNGSTFTINLPLM